jgi:hypothetical protein
MLRNLVEALDSLASGRACWESVCRQGLHLLGFSALMAFTPSLSCLGATERELGLITSLCDRWLFHAQL